MKTTENDIINIISKIIKNDELNDKSSLGMTQNWDSLNHLKIIIELEEKYHIKIKDEDIDKLLSIETIVPYINNINN